MTWFAYDTERPPEDVTGLVGKPTYRRVTAQGRYEGLDLDVLVGQELLIEGAFERRKELGAEDRGECTHGEQIAGACATPLQATGSKRPSRHQAMQVDVLPQVLAPGV